MKNRLIKLHDIQHGFFDYDMSIDIGMPDTTIQYGRMMSIIGKLN